MEEEGGGRWRGRGRWEEGMEGRQVGRREGGKEGGERKGGREREVDRMAAWREEGKGTRGITDRHTYAQICANTHTLVHTCTRLHSNIKGHTLI